MVRIDANFLLLAVIFLESKLAERLGLEFPIRLKIRPPPNAA
jgi:hypothetical protein